MHLPDCDSSFDSFDSDRSERYLKSMHAVTVMNDHDRVRPFPLGRQKQHSEAVPVRPTTR